MPVLVRLRHLAVIPLLSLLVFSGCSSDPGPGGRRAGAAGSRGKAPTPMAGHEMFFGGQLLAEIHVGTDGVPDVAAGDGDGTRRESGSRGRRSGGGSLNVAGGAGGVGGNISGGVPFGGGGRASHQAESREGVSPGPHPMAGGGMGRPVMIHLRFTNQGAAPVTLHIDDFVSPLGNFAVRPDKLVLASGQSLETEPMSSQLAGGVPRDGHHPRAAPRRPGGKENLPAAGLAGGGGA